MLLVIPDHTAQFFPPVTTGVFGPLLFITSLLPFGKTFHTFNIHFPYFVDDTQLYISSKPKSCLSRSSLTWSSEIRLQFISNVLKLNSNKAEVLLTKSTLSKVDSFSVTTDSARVPPR